MKLIQLTGLFIYAACLILTGSDAAAQEAAAKSAIDSTEQVSLSGSIDTYFHKAFNTTETAPRTSFANLPGFSLGMVNLIGAYKNKRSGFVADLVFGPRGSDAMFNAPMYTNPKGASSAHIINQLFVYYNVSNSVRMTLGQFNTFFSYETITPTKNYHYSTSYLFSYGPFNHTGLMADFDLKKGWMAKLAIMNPTDYTEFNPFNSFTIGGQLSTSGNIGSGNFNFSYGDPDGEMNSADSIGSTSLGKALHLDLNSTLHITERYSVGISASFKTMGSGELKVNSDESVTLKKTGFNGVILYQTLALSSTNSIGLRTEYFSEFNNGVNAIGAYTTSGNASVVACTLSGNIIKNHFRFIPEIRWDNASSASFHKFSNGEATSQMISFNAAVVFTVPELSHKFHSK